METTASFGYWIRRQRKAFDLTQQALAKRVGCSLAAIKKIEGDVYASLQRKQDAINRLLWQLNADNLRLRQLVSWQWIQDVFAQPPA